ncbi:hypothetical protein RB595_003522 [Gaeumannomyces hyphopodioides]
MANTKADVSQDVAHAAAVPSQQQPLCHIHTPVGMMGYGFDEDLTRRELARLVSTGVPTALILDSGSTDSGPQKLALGSMTSPRAAYVQELSRLLRLCHEFRVPLLFASAGGDGSDEHVREMGEIIKEICSEVGNENYRFKAISLFAGIDKKTVMDRFDQGRLVGCGPCVPPATAGDIDASPHVVAQMGLEPFVDAMGAHPDFDVIVGGRAYDPAPYAAWCIHQLRLLQEKNNSDNGHTGEIDPRVVGGFLHMGKIMECGGLCATPKCPGATATIYPDGVFDVRPAAPGSRCTPASVAAHALYENTRPDVLRGPGGELRLGAAKYRQLPRFADDEGEHARAVRVDGAVFARSRDASGGGSRQPWYTAKLEAARVVGYRAIAMGSVKDRVLISMLDEVLARVKAYVAAQHAGINEGAWDLGFHVYGREVAAATVDTRGLVGGRRSHGAVFIVAEALAPTQALANSIISKARIAMIHAPYPGQKATSGNLGFGIGGLMEIEAGPCAEFSLYHLMDLEPGEERVAMDNVNGHVLADGKEERRGKPPLFRAEVATFGQGPPKPPIQSVTYSSARGMAVHGRDVEDGSVQSGGHAGDGSASDKAARATPACSPPSPRRTTLFDLCQVLRSKNAGPYEITLDAIFASGDDYVRVRDSGVLSRQRVASALGVSETDIVWMGFWDAAAAFKVTIPRRRCRPGGGKSIAAAGGFMEDDVHGSQEHLGLADIEVPATDVGAVVSL